jgi:broad specificity phosphatase PhoE
VKGLVAQFGDTEATVALVGHGGLYRLMLPLVLANVSAAFAMETPIPNASYVRAETRGGVLAAVEWCGQSTAL